MKAAALFIIPGFYSSSNANQAAKIRCGDNGIFKGVPVTLEQKELTRIAKEFYDEYGSDGKYILDGERLIICQSNASADDLRSE